MSDKKKKKKRVVKTNRKKSKRKKRSRRSRRSSAKTSDPLILGQSNYIYMLIGFGLILSGLLLMMGGGMASPEVWEEDIIYSFRRTVLAPFIMIVGLLVEIYAIFKD